MITVLAETRIEYLTSAEVADAIASGSRTAILPLAAVEQHGPHLTLSMDADHADDLAVRVAAELGRSLVLPTVRVGYSPHHLGFAGTLSLRATTLQAICQDYGDHLAASGFERMLVFSSHIGNYPVMREFEASLARDLAPLSVIVYTDAAAVLAAWRRAAHVVAGLGDHVGGHADVAETSVMLALHPRKVRADRLAAGYPGPVNDAFLRRLFREGIAGLSPSGVLGNPSGASEDIGIACLEAVTSLIVRHARDRGA